MGWLFRSAEGQTNDDIKQQHEQRITDYGDRAKAELLAAEWHNGCAYFLIRLTYAPGSEKAGKTETFLRTDLVQISGFKFGYKDMEESMGPYLPQKPSRSFSARVFEEIPYLPSEYARNFREWAGIRYRDPAQLQLII